MDGLRHANMFPGVDLVFAHDGDRLEAVFIVAPDADPGRVRLAFPRATRAALARGAVSFVSGTTRTVLQPPEAWERRGRRRMVEVPVWYGDRSRGGVRIGVGDYDTSRTLLVRIEMNAAATVPAVTASARDSFQTDADADNKADVGDVIQYDVTISNVGGTSDAADVMLDFTEDPNTTAAMVNITPIANDQARETPENTAKAITLTGIDLDPGETSTLTFMVVTPPPAAEGTLTGTAPNLTFTPAAGFDGVAEFSFKATDAKGDDSNEPGTVRVTVASANTAPSITSAAAANTAENTTGVVDVQSTDPDGEAEGAGLTYSLTGGADQAKFAINANTGVLTFAAAPDFDVPGDAGGNNIYEVQVTVTDSGALTDVQDLQVTVTGVDEPPTISSSATPMVAENQTGAVDVQSTDPEGETEGGGGLTYSKTGGLDQALFGLNVNTGVLTFNAAPNFEAPVDNGMNNIYDVQVTVTDSGALTGVQDIAVQVTNVNEAPMGTADAFDFVGNTLLLVDKATTGAPEIIVATGSTNGVLDNDTDPEGAISVSGIVGCVDVTAPFTDCPTTNTGSVTMESNGQFSFTPDDGDANATDTFQYNLFDGTTTLPVTVTLTRKNEIWFVDNSAAARRPRQIVRSVRHADGGRDRIRGRRHDLRRRGRRHHHGSERRHCAEGQPAADR